MVNKRNWAGETPPPMTEGYGYILNTKEKEQQFEAELEEGHYLGLLETYDVSWSEEKAVRDIWQNFFDGAGGTLDNIPLEIEKLEDGKVKIKITGDSNFDFKKLLHMGGTGEKGKMTAGGKGEGTKISALTMLRDLGFEKIEYGSTGWRFEFYLDDVPEEQYDQKVRGLHGRLEKVENDSMPGNYIELIANDPEKAEVFKNARDLFFHEGNEDFHDPTFVSKSGFGFKFLGSDDEDRGHLYDAGQRRHFETDTDNEEWETAEQINIWTKIKQFDDDRDRGSVSRRQVREKIIEPMIKETGEADLIKIVQNFKKIWEEGGAWSYYLSYEILEKTIDKLEGMGVKLEFDDNYLANDLGFCSEVEDALKNAGYKLCSKMFGKIGMKYSREKFTEMQKHLQKEPSPEQKERINVLVRAVEVFKKELDEIKEDGSKIISKEVWIYGREDEKSIINGQYDEEFVWMAEEMLAESFPQALGTYLHELDHKFGSDSSAKFSYAITDTLELVIEVMIKNPQAFQKLQKEWDSIQIEKVEKK